MDDTTFTVDLNQSDSVFPIKVGYSAFAPLPESFYKDRSLRRGSCGNGPYKFSKWDHNKEIALVKNPDYKGNEDVKNDGVTFKVYTDDSAAYRDIQAGNLDVMESVPAAFTKTFKTDKKVQAYSEAGSVIQTFTIRPPLTTSRTTRKASCVVRPSPWPSTVTSSSTRCSTATPPPPPSSPPRRPRATPTPSRVPTT